MEENVAFVNKNTEIIKSVLKWESRTAHLEEIVNTLLIANPSWEFSTVLLTFYPHFHIFFQKWKDHITKFSLLCYLFPPFCLYDFIPLFSKIIMIKLFRFSIFPQWYNVFFFALTMLCAHKAWLRLITNSQSLCAL